MTNNQSVGGDGGNSDPVRADVISKVIHRLMPLLFIGAVLAQLDRVNVSMASLSMTGDIALSPAAYGFGVGAFFIIYALCEIPSNAGLARFGARRWIARIMLTWGIISAATAFVVGPTTFIANRALLAAAEAGFLPGVLAFLATWLPAADRARVFSLFLMAIPIANILGGPLAAGILALDGWLGLHGWQWLFLLEGLPPILLALIIWSRLPDTPGEADWLTEREVAVLAAEASSGLLLAHLTFRTFLRAIVHPRVLLFTAVLGCLGGINQAVTFWLPQIVRSLGLTVMQTGFAVALPFLVGAAVMVAWSAHSDRTGERRWHLAGPAILAGIALAASAWLPGVGIRMALVTVAITCVLAIQGVFWSAVSVALEGHERTIGMGAVSAGGILFAFLAPFLIGVSKQWTGGFDAAFTILGVLGVVGGALALAMATWVPGPRFSTTREA